VSTNVDDQAPGLEPGRHGPPTMTVTVFVPRATDPQRFTWPQTMKVGEAAAQAADAFGYEPGNPSLQNKAGEVLDRNKPLVAAGIRDGDELELVDVGGGV
jgi:hypothetical protein